MKILIFVLLWLLVNTWIGICVVTDEISIRDSDDIKMVALFAICSYPLVLLAYKITKHVKRSWKRWKNKRRQKKWQRT